MKKLLLLVVFAVGAALAIADNPFPECGETKQCAQ